MEEKRNANRHDRQRIDEDSDSSPRLQKSDLPF